MNMIVIHPIIMKKNPARNMLSVKDFPHIIENYSEFAIPVQNDSGLFGPFSESIPGQPRESDLRKSYPPEKN